MRGGLRARSTGFYLWRRSKASEEKSGPSPWGERFHKKTLADRSLTGTKQAQCFRYRQTIHPVSTNVPISAAGIAAHTPATPRNRGSTSRKTVISPNVRKKDMAAETFPFDSAVNRAEAKILHPENRKLNEKIENPSFASS